MDEFADCELDALVAHGLRALRDCLPNEVDLTNKVQSKGVPVYSLVLDQKSCCISKHAELFLKTRGGNTKQVELMLKDQGGLVDMASFHRCNIDIIML